jgi:hypothetical protein
MGICLAALMAGQVFGYLSVVGNFALFDVHACETYFELLAADMTSIQLSLCERRIEGASAMYLIRGAFDEDTFICQCYSEILISRKFLKI